MTPLVTVREDKPGLPPVLLGVALFFLPPLGLYLLWNHPVYGKRKEWWIGACTWSLLWLGGVMRKQEQSKWNDAMPMKAVREPAEKVQPNKADKESKLAEMRSRVRVGMSRQEVEKALGPPEARHDLGESRFNLPDEQWTYLDDSLGVNFRKGRVWLIQP